MSKLVWDADGTRNYETGTSQVALFVKASSGSYGTGVAWNGVTAITEKPSGADETKLYADDIKYASLRAAEEFGCTIEAYTYPDEFAECDGSAEIVSGVKIGQQKRTSFGLAYVTQKESDVEANAGYLLHLVYNCYCSPSERSYATINDSPSAITFSWEISSTPTNVTGHKPTSVITIDSTKVDATKLATLVAKVYGGDSTEPTLPSPDEVIAIFGTAAG